MLRIILASACILTCIVTGSPRARTFSSAPCTGIKRHCMLFKTEIDKALSALNRAAATDSVATAYSIACSVSVREAGLLALFTVTDSSADTVTARELIAYHDIPDIGPVTALFFSRLQNDSVVAPRHKTADGKPVITLQNYSASALKYRTTEHAWLEQGAPLPEWHKYYGTQAPITDWAGRHRFNERAATLLGVLPCCSGHLYTRQINIGLFWSVSELALLVYGLTRTDPFQRGAVLTALIPLTALDGILSRISARKINEVTDSIEGLYPDKKYPFSFMRQDTDAK